MKKIIRILSVASLSLILLLLGAMIILPKVFKDDIYVLAKKEIERNIDANVELGDLQISFFKNFPKPAVTINNFKITGKGIFENNTLIKIGEAVAQIDLSSLLNMENGIEISKISIKDTDLDIQVHENGISNYNISTSYSETENYNEDQVNNSGINLELKALKISNFNFIYKDSQEKIFADIKNLNTKGFIKISDDEYLIESESDIESLSIEYGDINYLNETALSAKINCLANLDKMIFTLKENAIRLNALSLNAEGFIDLEDESIITDLRFNAPGNSFGELFSLVPAAYTEDYKDIDFGGSFKLDGVVKGAYYEEHYPAIKLDITASNGNVQYPDLPFPIRDINAQVNILKSEGDLDNFKIDIPVFSMNLQEQILSGKFKLSTPLSNPSIDMALNGKLDLNTLGKAFPIEDIKALEGIVSADFNFKANYKQIENEAYEQMEVGGSISLSDFKTIAYDYPPVAIDALEAKFAPQKISVDNFSSSLGQSDLSGYGYVENLLAYFYPEQTMKGAFKITSNYLNANEWLTESENSTEKEQKEEIIEVYENESLTALPVEKFDFTLDASFDKIDYDAYTINNLKTKGHMTSKFLAAEQFSANIEDTDFNSSGILRNIFGFLLSDEILEGELNVQAKRLNLNPFMVSESPKPDESNNSEEESSYELVVIPKNIKLKLNAAAKQILYEEIELNDFRGSLLVNDGQLILDQCYANSMGGSMLISGAYDTFDPKDPGFNFKFDLQSIDFDKAFNSLNTYQKLAPIGAFMTGSFNTSLVMDGKMGQDMMPIMDQLNAQGFLHTIAGEIKEFKTLQAVDNKLGLDLFNGIKLKDTKNWFEIKNGLVEVKDFDINYKDIDLTIGGTHSLSQEIDYTIKATIPSSMYENGLAGNAVDAGYALINNQANKMGVEVQKAERINLAIGLSGKSASPEVDIKLLGAEGSDDQKLIAEQLKEELSNELSNQSDKLKETAEEKLDKLKEKATADAGKKKSELEGKLKNEAEDIKEEAALEAERILKKNLEKARLDSILKARNKKAEEDIKKKLEQFNPLKRKKKGN